MEGNPLFLLGHVLRGRVMLMSVFQAYSTDPNDSIYHALSTYSFQSRFYAMKYSESVYILIIINFWTYMSFMFSESLNFYLVRVSALLLSMPFILMCVDCP